MNKNVPLFLTLLAIVIASCYSCSQEQAYPQELVMADSAYMAGNYQLADSLMETFSEQQKEGNDDNSYYNLLRLEQAFANGSLSSDHFSLADSLYRSYSNDSQDAHLAKASLFVGTIYHKNGEYPTAMEYYLEAKEKAVASHDSRLLCLISKKLGDLYFDQRLLDDCIPYYRDYYRMAVQNNDTLRMAYGARCMDLVCTINNDVDSIIFYCKRSMELGESLPQSENILSRALYDLCDIYIQTEQFDKALEIMPHDELNDANWAYWHYGQHHLDSAAYYFKKTLGRFKWQGEVEVLRNLALLERERGNISASLDYYDQLAAAEDSLRAQQRTEETKRIEAQYNFSRIQQQRDELEQHSQRMKQSLLLLGLATAILLLTALILWRMYVEKKRSSLFIQQRLEQEKEVLEEQGRERQRENSERLAALEQQLEQARQQHDSQASERLADEARLLKARNESIEAFQQRKESLLRELYSQAYYHRLKADGPSVEKRLTDEEWDDLAQRLDDIYQGLTERLQRLGDLSKTELRICYLLKLGVKPTDIAAILDKTRSAITQARKRMYRKLTGTSGTAEDFDALLQEL